MTSTNDNPQPTDAAGFPIGTRWVAVTAFDADGVKLDRAVADVLNFRTAAHANSAALGALIAKHGSKIATHKVEYGF